MGKDAPSPPPAPDYRGAAQEQGVANIESARATAKLSNPNMYTPYGTQGFGILPFGVLGLCLALIGKGQQILDIRLLR